jgi:DNA-binding SARP family transcriptional activator
MPPVHLALLGPFQARRADGRTVHVRRRKAQALLAYLALRPGDAQPREKVIALLWPEEEPGRARHNLRQTLTVLRRDLAPRRRPAGLFRGEALCLEPDRVAVDVMAFERLARSREVADLDAAAALYRGDLLEGLVPGGEVFEAWLTGERDRLRAVFADVLGRLLGIRMERGALIPAAETAVRLLALEPLREDVHRALMRLYVRQGRPAAALGQYRACASLLRRELGVAPEDATTELYRAILGKRRATAANGWTVDWQPRETWEQAVWRHRLAADGAVMRSAFSSAVAFLEGALAAAARLPAGCERAGMAADVHLAFERALVPLGEIDRLRDHLRRAAALVPGDLRRLGWVAAQRMSCELWDGAAAAAVAAGEQALVSAEVTGDTELALSARCRLAQAYYYRGDFALGTRLAGELVELPGDLSIASSGHGVLPGVHTRVYLALCLVSLGHFGRGRDTTVEAVRLAARANHAWSLAYARYALGVVDLMRGDVRAAYDAFAGAYALGRGPDGEPLFHLPRAPAAFAYALAGRSGEGSGLAGGSTVEGTQTFRGRELATLARWHLRQGEIEKALRHGKEAVALARRQGQRAVEASRLHVLTQILARMPDDAEAPRRALAAGQAALALAEGLGMRPLALRCHETLGELWHRVGELDKARTAGEAAARLRSEMSSIA